MPKILAAIAAALLAVPLAAEYPLGPDSIRREGVPQGRVEKFEWTSEIYPGTVRDAWVYIPAQYDGAEPAAVMIFQDGGSFVRVEGERAWMTPVVLDNLIHQGRMPVTVGIFLQWGLLPAQSDEHQARYNRSFEYDALGDRYANFLIQEILPEVSRRFSLSLSGDPNLRGVGGSSSGAICAFNAAWERPDAFRRVLSFIGSYVNLRGANILPSLIRKHEPKPLRVFLQDGRADLNIYSGSWWMANQAMALALDYAGYDRRWVIGDESHNNLHGRALLPDALAWLWRDWNQPIAANRKALGERHFVNEFLDPDSDWELVSEGHDFTEGPAVAPNGDVYFTDVRRNEIWRVDAASGRAELFKKDSGGANGLMFGPDGRLHAANGGRKAITAIDVASGREDVLAEGPAPNDLVVTAEGVVYFTEPATKQVWRIGKDGKLAVAVEEKVGVERPNGVMLSPDQSLLTVADSYSKWVWSFQIRPDGSLAAGQPFYRLETPDASSRSMADGMTMTADGHLIVASAQGLQICDQPGRVVGIISKPQRAFLSNAVFAGEHLDTLYVTSSDKVYRRKTRMKGVQPWVPVKPPRPGL